MSSVHIHAPEELQGSGPGTDPDGCSLLAGLRWADVEESVRSQQRSRERHTPAISTFRWWARRSHALIGALLDGALEGREHLAVGDPFSGGGTVAVEAARRGMDVYAQDLHPWPVTALRTTLEPVDLEVLQATAEALKDALGDLRREAYGTVCPGHKSPSEVLTSFWVRTGPCPACAREVHHFPYSLISRASRSPTETRSWWGCRACGAATCLADGARGRRCESCGRRFELADEHLLASREACCPHAGCVARFVALGDGPARWRLVLVQRLCRQDGKVALHFDRPTPAEVRRAVREAPDVPTALTEEIPEGLETRVLRRAGMRTWADLYAPRQLQVFSAALAAIDELDVPPAIRSRLLLAVCGCAEMAGHVSRWDRYYPKAFEAVANHRFAVTGLSVETNLLADRGRGSLPRRLGHMVGAAVWIQDELPAKLRVRSRSSFERRRRPSGVLLAEGTSERQLAADGSLDLVLTDPPYFKDVQYAELAGMFLAWSRAAGLVAASTHLDLRSEAVANTARGTGVEQYRRLLTAIFSESRRTIRPGGRMVLTYHNTDLRAWWALGSALRDAGFGVRALAVTHAENERDHAKRGRLAFSRDLVIECRTGPSRAPEVVWHDADEAEAVELIAAGRALAEMPQSESAEAFRARFRTLRGDIRPVRIGRRGSESVTEIEPDA